MGMQHAELILCKDWIIPKNYLEQYASNISYSKGYSGQIPAPPKEYFIQRFLNFHEEPIPEKVGSYNIMPMIGDKMVGWGHLSWSNEQVPESQPGGELFIYVRPEERRKGLGTRMCKALLEKSPEKISCLEIPAPEESGAFFSEITLGAVQASEKKRNLMALEQLDLAHTLQKAEKNTQLAEDEGLEINLLIIESLEQKFDIPTFVKLKNQTLTDDQLEEAVKAFKAIMRRDFGRESIYWIATAAETSTDTIVGYSHSVFNAEGNQGTVIDLETFLIEAYHSVELYLALKSKILEHLQHQTPATHWISYEESSNQALQKADQELGFGFFTTHKSFHIDRDTIESFMQNT